MSEAAVITRGAMNGNPSAAGSVLIIDDEADGEGDDRQRNGDLDAVDQGL